MGVFHHIVDSIFAWYVVALCVKDVSSLSLLLALLVFGSVLNVFKVIGKLLTSSFPPAVPGAIHFKVSIFDHNMIVISACQRLYLSKSTS